MELVMKLLKFVTAEAMNIYILAAVVIAYVVVRRVWLQPRELERRLKAQGLKAHPYRLWHGDMKDFAGMAEAAYSAPIGLHDDIAPYALPFYHHTVTTYGKRSFMWAGPKPRIIIMEPEMIKDVLQKIDVFQKPKTNPLFQQVFPGLVSHEGGKWAKHRRLLTPCFTVAKVKDMVATMHICCNELVETLQETMSKSNEVDFWPILTTFTADIISRTAFGSNYEKGQKVFLLQKEQSRLLLLLLNQSVYIPGSRFLPTRMNRRLKEANREIEEVVKGIIQEKIEGMKAGETDSNDLLGVLLESNFREVGKDREMGISIKDVIDECKLFYFAGQEMTSTLLVWTIVMLSIHRNWQMEARQEVFDVFENNIPDFDGLHQLKKMNMILHEVLRLYSPATIMVRSSKKNTKVGDIIIPEGVQIVLPTLLIHHDKEIWGDDAKEFKPERFAQGVAKATNGQLAAFFPFGLGPRICIGMNFAMVEAKLALAMILQRFSLELSPNYEHAPVPMLSLQPKFGAKISLSKI